MTKPRVSELLKQLETARRQVELAEQLEDAAKAENAKLKADLAEATELLKSIEEFAHEMHQLLTEDPPSNPEVTRRWGRIVDFLAKH